MLDPDFPHVADLMSSRTALHTLLLDVADPALCKIILVKKTAPNSASKELFHVLDPVLCDDIRHKWEQLELLHQKLADLDVDFKANQGLWVPALADQDRGDYQANLTVSQSWATKNVTAREIIDFAKDGESGAVLHYLEAHQEYGAFRLCRECGKTYKVAVRNNTEKRKMYGVNEFCIVLGAQIIVNESDPRPRSQREDAWRGVTPPLFTFSGKRGQLWWVYPPKEEDVLDG